MYVSGRLSVMRHLLGNEAVARGGQVGTGKDSPPHMVYLNFPTSASKSAVRGFHAHLSPAASFWGRLQSLLCSTSPSLLQMKRGKRKHDSPARGFERSLEFLPIPRKKSHSLGLSRGKDLISFDRDSHLPGPPWTQGQGHGARGTLYLAGWGFSLAGELHVGLSPVCLAQWPVV